MSDEIVQCLICEKQIEYQGFVDGLPSDLSGAGYVIIQMGWGSRFDQLGARSMAFIDIQSHIDELSVSDEITALICDDCFENKSNLMRGCKIVTKPNRIPIDEYIQQQSSSKSPKSS